MIDILQLVVPYCVAVPNMNMIVMLASYRLALRVPRNTSNFPLEKTDSETLVSCFVSPFSENACQHDQVSDLCVRPILAPCFFFLCREFTIVVNLQEYRGAQVTPTATSDATRELCGHTSTDSGRSRCVNLRCDLRRLPRCTDR